MENSVKLLKNNKKESEHTIRMIIPEELEEF